jgi:hypothetical protein
MPRLDSTHGQHHLSAGNILSPLEQSRAQSKTEDFGVLSNQPGRSEISAPALVSELLHSGVNIEIDFQTTFNASGASDYISFLRIPQCIPTRCTVPSISTPIAPTSTLNLLTNLPSPLLTREQTKTSIHKPSGLIEGLLKCTQLSISAGVAKEFTSQNVSVPFNLKHRRGQFLSDQPHLHRPIAITDTLKREILRDRNVGHILSAVDREFVGSLSSINRQQEKTEEAELSTDKYGMLSEETMESNNNI